MPVTVPRRAKPTMSICLREATSAPEMAKTITPSQSRAAAAVSKTMGGTTQAATAMDEASATGHLFAGPVFLFGELRRQRRAEVGGLEHWADFDFARAGHRIGAALHPCDRLGHVLDLPEPEAGNQLAGLREGPVDLGAARAVEGHALAL